MMKKKLLWVLRLTFSGGILFYVFSIIPFEKVLSNIYAAKIGYIAIGFVVMQTVVFVSACKLKIVINRQQMSLSVGSIFRINYMTKFYDLFLPQVVSGGLIRWYILSKQDKKPAQALASMVFNRFTEFQMIVILGFIFWGIDKPPKTNEMVGISLIALIFLLFVLYLVVFNKKFIQLLLNILKTLPFLPQTLINKLTKLLISMSEYQKLSASSFLGLWGLNLLQHLLGILGYYFFAFSLDLTVTYANIAWIRSIIIIICTIPVTIGGFGVREGSLIFLLGMYGISSSSAVAFSFLVYICGLVGGLIGGMIVAASMIFHERKTAEVDTNYGRA